MSQWINYIHFIMSYFLFIYYTIVSWKEYLKFLWLYLSLWFSYAGWVSSWGVKIHGGSLWFQLSCYLVPHWCCVSYTHTNEQERIIALYRPRVIVYEGLVLLTANISSVFVQISKREKEKKKKAISFWFSANRFIPNAAVVHDKRMIGRIYASGKKRWISYVHCSWVDYV